MYYSSYVYGNKKLDTGDYNYTDYQNYGITNEYNSNKIVPRYYIYPDKPCEMTGSWNSNILQNKCIHCVSGYGFYGEKKIFCDGKCIGKYDNLGMSKCSSTSLVAENINQCFNPCYNSIIKEPKSDVCSSDTDCGKFFKCDNTDGSSGNCKFDINLFMINQPIPLPPETTTPAPETTTLAPETITEPEKKESYYDYGYTQLRPDSKEFKEKSLYMGVL
jgi:hypothetical protein